MLKTFLGALAALTVGHTYVQNGLLAAVGAGCCCFVGCTLVDLASRAARALRGRVPPPQRPA